jgi:hypothetical protein
MSTFVLFIGGYKATIGDINLWTASAGGQKQDWIFDGYPWPPSATDKDKPADSGATSAVAAFTAAKSMPEAIKKIVDGKYDEVYIVGHSSGCAIANKIDEELMVALGETSTVKVNLVALDGFRPSPAQLNRPTTQVWCAKDGKNENQSKNYPSLKGTGGLKMYTAQACTNIWSLHFSLVNTFTSDKTVKSNKDIPNGYLGCRANLCWMPSPFAQRMMKKHPNVVGGPGPWLIPPERT